MIDWFIIKIYISFKLNFLTGLKITILGRVEIEDEDGGLPEAVVHFHTVVLVQEAWNIVDNPVFDTPLEVSNFAWVSQV